MGAFRHGQVSLALHSGIQRREIPDAGPRGREADNRGPEYNFYGAPVNIIISYKRDEHHAFVDGAAAMENLLLMATELGLGSCWINQIRECCDDPKVRSLLTEYGVPEDHIVICSAAIGYIAKETPAKPRKEGIVSFVE